jgi:hypothetical protein
MTRIVLFAILACFMICPAFAEYATSTMTPEMVKFAQATVSSPKEDLFKITDGGPVTVVQHAPIAAGSVVNVGGVFGPIIEPYVNSLVGLLLSAMCGWILVQVKTKLGINIDQAQADVYLRAAKNQASSLVADGFVKIEQSGKVTVNNAALAAAANDLLSSVPEAAAHFTLTNKPDDVAKKIVDMIPQVPAHAAAVQGAATVVAAASDAAQKVADAPDVPIAKT